MAAGNVFSKIPVTEDIDGEGILTYGTNAGEEKDFAVIRIKVSLRNYRDGELTVKIAFAGKEPVQISGISMTDSVYNKRAVSYSGTVYSASPNAPVHAGDCVLTVAVAEENEIYTGSALADGFSMKYTEQTVKNDNKAQAVFGSLKYKKAMKLGTDYTVSLKADTDVQYDGNSALEEGEIPSMWFGEMQQQGKGYSAPAIPQGYYGSFIMTVTGMGNYTGTVTKTIVVAKQ